MAAESVQNPPSMSKRLARQWLWAGIALAVVVLVILIKSADLDVNRPGGTGDSCQVEINADPLNVRAAPVADAPIVDTLSRGRVVNAQPEVANGFRKLEDNRWVADRFVTPNDRC